MQSILVSRFDWVLIEPQVQKFEFNCHCKKHKFYVFCSKMRDNQKVWNVEVFETDFPQASLYSPLSFFLPFGVLMISWPWDNFKYLRQLILKWDNINYSVCGSVSVKSSWIARGLIIKSSRFSATDSCPLAIWWDNGYCLRQSRL